MPIAAADARMDAGRAMVMEILIPTAAIRNLIREDKIHQIYSAMQTGTGTSGMQTFNQSLANAYLTEINHSGNGARAIVESRRIAGFDQPGVTSPPMQLAGTVPVNVIE